MHLFSLHAMDFFKTTAKLISSNRATSSTSSQQVVARQPQPLLHRIFTIPEILESILSFLSTHALKYRAGLVCHLWRELSLRSLSSLPITADWTSFVYTTEAEEAIFRDKLATCRYLHLRSWTGTRRVISPNDTFTVWNDIQEAVVEQYQSNKLFKTTQLIVEGDFPIATTVEPLLKKAPLLATSLTTIRIEKYSGAKILYIDYILGACMNLVDLHLEAKTASSKAVQLGLQADSMDWTEKPLKLQRLTLTSLSIPYQQMKVLLPLCPFLKSFEVVDAHGVDPFPISQFYHLIKRCLPFLDHIRVSIFHPKMSSSDATVFREVFSHVKSWSFHPRDMENCDFWPLKQVMPKPQSPLQVVMFPILTSLEIVCKSRIRLEEHHGSLGNTLQTYLVSPAAASLVNLKVENFCFLYSNFELTSNQYHKLWTCRRLETLHMHVHVSSLQSTEPAPISRMILSYLTHLLTRMQDLRLEIDYLDFELEGGLCLLKRMRYLENVHIITRSHGRFSERSLHWLNRHPTATQRIRRGLWVRQLRRYLGFDQKLQNEIVHRESSIRSLEDLIDCLEGKGSGGNGGNGGGELGDHGAVRCLPCLESLVIETRNKGLDARFKDYDTASTQLMKSFRPDCRFRIIRHS